MSYRRLDTLTDISRKGYWVRIKCACGHEYRDNPMVLLDRMQKRGKIEGHLNRLHRVMKCGRCGGKDFKAEHCPGPAIWS